MLSQALELNCRGSNLDPKIQGPCNFGASVSLHEL